MNTPSPNPRRWTPRTMRWTAETGVLAVAAARLVAANIPVFPCVPGGKQPLTAHGFLDATTDLSRVKEWWRRIPEANIGLPTGTASGVVVVDVDVHAGGNGFAAFEHARAVGLVDGWGWLVRTPSGGLHAYFRTEGAEQRSWTSPTTHVDFRGDGGYVVAPPSRVITNDGTSVRYDVITVAQHQPRSLDSQALRALLEPPKPTRPPGDLPVVGSRPDKLAAWVASRPEGARNDGLFWAACRLAEDGHSLQTALGVLGEAARSAGLSDRETETTIRSAHRKAAPLSTARSPDPPPATHSIGR